MGVRLASLFLAKIIRKKKWKLAGNELDLLAVYSINNLNDEEIMTNYWEVLHTRRLVLICKNRHYAQTETHQRTDWIPYARL